MEAAVPSATLDTAEGGGATAPPAAPGGRGRRASGRKDPSRDRQYYASKKAALAALEAEAVSKRAMVDELIAQRKELVRREQLLQLSIDTREQQMAVLDEMQRLGVTAPSDAGRGGPGAAAPAPAARGSGGGVAAPPAVAVAALSAASDNKETPAALLKLLRDAEDALHGSRSCDGSPTPGSEAAAGDGKPPSGGGRPPRQASELVQMLQQVERQQAAARTAGAPLPLPLGRRPSSVSSVSGASSASGMASGADAAGEQLPLTQLPLTREHATQRYLAYMQEASRLLLKAGSPREEEAAEAVADLEVATRQLHDDMRGYAWLSTSQAVRLRGQHISDPGRSGDDALWASVLSRVTLSEEEEEGLVGAFDLYLEEAVSRHAGIKKDATRLRDLLGGEYLGLTLSREEQRRAEMAALVDSLQRAMAAEDEAGMRLYIAITRLLSALALAQLMVGSFPYWPDMYHMFELLQEKVHARRTAARPGNGTSSGGSSGGAIAGTAAAARRR